MNLILKAGNKRFAISLEEKDCNKLFNYLVMKVFQSSVRVTRNNDEVSECTSNNEISCVKTESLQEKIIVPGYGYNGFLVVKCSHCGKIKAFRSKDRLKSFICMECGEITEFTELFRKLYFNCKCGKKFVYMTNLKDDFANIECLNCKTQFTVKYNRTNNTYESELIRDNPS